MSPKKKIKSLLKNLRFMFENEKEPEMQIGFPTDVKHVAHIGWDGPSVNSPGWMNEFISPNGFVSAPLAPPGQFGQNNDPIQWASQDKGRSSRATDLPEATRRNSSAIADSPKREKSDRTKSTRRSSKSSKDDPDGARPRRSKEPNQDSDSISQDLHDIPKTRRKKLKDSSSKDSFGGKSSRRTKNQLEAASESGSVAKSRNSERRHAPARDSLEELEEAIS